jgi:predicted DNA binding CopG/RHH family protein
LTYAVGRDKIKHMSKQMTENDTRVSYRLPSDHLKAIRREAKVRHLDVADVLREMTRDWIAKREPKRTDVLQEQSVS